MPGDSNGGVVHYTSGGQGRSRSLPRKLDWESMEIQRYEKCRVEDVRIRFSAPESGCESLGGRVEDERVRTGRGKGGGWVAEGVSRGEGRRG